MSAACHLATCHPWEQRPDGSVITFVPFISRHQDTKITIMFIIITITTIVSIFCKTHYLSPSYQQPPLSGKYVCHSNDQRHTSIFVCQDSALCHCRFLTFLQQPPVQCTVQRVHQSDAKVSLKSPWCQRYTNIEFSLFISPNYIRLQPNAPLANIRYFLSPLNHTYKRGWL